MKPGKFEIYKDKAHEWRYRLKSPNGKIVADSGEGYRSRRNVVNAINRLPGIMAGAMILDAPYKPRKAGLK